jgi:hypothetical protein
LSKGPSTGTSCASLHVQVGDAPSPLTFDLLSYHINVAINSTVARLAPVIGDPPMHSPKTIIHACIVNIPVHLTDPVSCVRHTSRRPKRPHPGGTQQHIGVMAGPGNNPVQVFAT